MGKCLLTWSPGVCRQEAVVAAISEKDAHIALLEMSPGPKPAASREEVTRLNKEKNRLQTQLKELVSTMGHRQGSGACFTERVRARITHIARE